MANSFAAIRFDGFFDRDNVVAAMDRKERRVLSGTGAYARGVMKKRMRRKKGISEPGGFPHAHEGSLRDKIFFSYDATDASVVVGPLLFKQALVGGKTVPELINEGGQAVISVPRGPRIVKRRATYRPRPFVELTLPHAARQMSKLMEEVPL